ncbi:lysozyme inhibitor LprI family protein [Aurantimonas sp. A2-1-M11]|uniref:lysozyme inhibitor LprI family protein n=1 Tax=Aurantimonas sp. A2-1-M11 TaxID=3113712 RepID=UPI002F93D5C9
MRLALPLILVLPLLALPARADDAYDACLREADASMQDMGACGGAWVEREDARLNDAWQALLAELPEDSQPMLRDEQRAWLTYRDQTCLFYLDPVEYGQIGRHLSYPSCRAFIIAQRTQALNEILASVAPM